MAFSQDNWVRVSQRTPCPLCDKPDNCTVSRDGRMVWCGRVAEGAIRRNDGGQYLHRLSDERAFLPPVNPRPKRKHAAPRKDWVAEAARLTQHAAAPRVELAAQLSVSEQALSDLNVGWDNVDRYWSFPERDGSGTIIGIAARYINGSKKRLSGSQAGLTYADTWDTGTGPILLVEGGSDTAALLTIGLNVVGRPSNRAGTKWLNHLLRDLPIEREVLVIGERDRKQDGSWPGKDGAIRTAQKLAESLERKVGWSLCPDLAKDARDWLIQRPSGMPRDRLAALFQSGLDPTWIEPPTTRIAPAPSGPEITLDDWRQHMLQTRIRSFDQPGYYLDASETGAGKSHVDVVALMTALHRKERV